MDQLNQATGKTTVASVVTPGSTAAVTVPGALAIGFYADSGFGTALTGGSGFTVRTNHSPNGEMDMLAEDQPVGLSATPVEGTGTGPNTGQTKSPALAAPERENTASWGLAVSAPGRASPSATFPSRKEKSAL